jgi:6-pyruvoyltetrahydropterin/6-carboxytetrahydropterin synthase
VKTRIGRHFSFEAAHQLRGEIYGKCQNRHGHRYELTVELEGDVNADGWICDFAELDLIVETAIIAKFDHQDLNQHFAVPTVENIARYIFEFLDQQLNGKSYNVARVLLYETAKSYAEVTR